MNFLIKKGQTESSLFFVLSGSMRIYFPNKEDEICVGFAHANNLICSYPSFILNRTIGLLYSSAGEDRNDGD